MPKYHVYGIFSASKYLGEFEANSQEEAEEMAAESPGNYASLCHQCAKEVSLSDCSATAFEVELVDEQGSTEESNHA